MGPWNAWCVVADVVTGANVVSDVVTFISDAVYLCNAQHMYSDNHADTCHNTKGSTG